MKTKSLHVILEEIKSKEPAIYRGLEDHILLAARVAGINTQDETIPKDGEHPKDPPINP